MSILSELVEKKDIDAYIKFRIEQLKLNQKGMKQIPENRREIFVESHLSKVRELKLLRKYLHQKGGIKKASIDICSGNWKDKKAKGVVD